MFTEIQISEPIDRIIDDWDFLNDKVMSHFSGFKAWGHNILGLRRRIIGPDGIFDPKKGNTSRVIVMDGEGIQERRNEQFNLTITPAGDPHRVMHSFGYWHINDKDELFLPIPAELAGELGHYVVIMGLPKGREVDSFAWYCEKCSTILYEHVIDTSKVGLAGFWKGEQLAVRTYNDDIHLRTCPECGHLNPHGYCWNKAKDTPEEAAARLCW
jgi:hypothetical protein